jgi:hypothetical protein
LSSLLLNLFLFFSPPGSAAQDHAAEPVLEVVSGRARDCRQVLRPQAAALGARRRLLLLGGPAGDLPEPANAHPPQVPC